MAEKNSFSREEFNKELINLGAEEDIEEDDFDDVKTQGVPEKPNFPTTIFIFAVILDVFTIASLGLLGWVTIPLGILLVRVYLLGKMSFSKKLAWKKVVAVCRKKAFPLLSAFLGSWAFFILRAHAKNYERIDQIISVVEKILTRKK
jgi:hypothetical protein